MSAICNDITKLFSQLDKFQFPFDKGAIPANGIYILFEKGESGHGVDRIVRVGTHTGDRQLPSRLRQHFLVENKDRSIFRKNIGRAFLNAENDPYLDVWNLDLTPRKAKEEHGHRIELEKQKQIEQRITDYLHSNFSFVVFPAETKDDRLRLESKIVSSVSLCKMCHPSSEWLGHQSPKARIRESGLWQVNELYKQPLSLDEVVEIRNQLGQ